MSLPIYPVERVIPQRPPMILIDEVVERRPRAITASVEVKPTGLFFQPGRGMPAHVALEWMAQTCAAYAGSDGLDGGGRVRVGFLLGTRNFRADRTWFAEGERLYVRATLEYHDDALGNFACEVAESADGPAIATASLNVFHPDDPQTVIEGRGFAP